MTEMKENNAINELKNRLKKYMNPEMWNDKSMFYRFLKARNFNVDLAETMMKNHLEWRKKHDVDNILKFKQPEVLEKYLPFTFIGYDKEGCVVRYVPSGNIDWIGLNLSVKREDFTKRIIYDIENDVQHMKGQTEKLGKSVNKSVFIHNLENLSFTQATNKTVIMNSLLMCDLYTNNYPEMLKAAYIIKANPYFSFIFSVMKRCLPNTIVSKMKIYSDDRWKKDLLDKIDANVLPAFLGGTRTDPDGNPLCNTFINHAGRIPETYYIHKSKQSLTRLAEVKSVTICRAAFHEVNLEVKEPGSYLEWKFETKSRDIGFGLFHQEIIDGEENNIELIPIQRINTDEYPEIGLFLCEKQGNYIIVFDNTYSWIRSKEIFYKVKIISPEEPVS